MIIQGEQIYRVIATLRCLACADLNEHVCDTTMRGLRHAQSAPEARGDHSHH